MMRPGPITIPAGEAPGGVVFHVYDGAGTLLAVDQVGPGDDVQAHAERAADVTNLEHDVDVVVLVAYDGDTGARFTLDDWLTP